MDPWVKFILGKDIQKTETAHDAGKECSWKAVFKFKYYDDSVITVTSFD